MIALLALLGCASAPSPVAAPPPAPPPALRIAGLGLPASREEAAAVRVAPTWTMGERTGPVRLQTLVRAGAPVGDTLFGQMVDAGGEPLSAPDGSTPWLSDALDFTALYDVDGSLFLATHLEARPATIYRTALALEADGTLQATATRAVDFTATRGAYNLCAGDVTPWRTHLAGEEYEPDASLFDPWGRIIGKHDRYLQEYVDTARALPATEQPRWVYDHGWVLEVAWGAQGETVARRSAMGRFSHELAIVMPDQRTVFLTDDMSRAGALLLFIADLPRDLSSGTLYALKWASGNAEWVSLGHAREADLAPALATRALTFSNLAAEARPVEGACAAPFRPMPARGSARSCVQILDEPLASRFETRRHAAWKGATVEWSKAEGLAVDAEGRRVFVALSTHLGAMADGTGDVALPENGCGAVWAFEAMADAPADSDGAPMNSAWVPTRFGPVLQGRPEGASCAEEAIANPDNLAFLEGHGLLAIAEDTRSHTSPTLWLWETGAPEAPPLRLATAPTCGEWSGLHWFPNVRGHAWLTVSLQHAFADTDGDDFKCGDAAALAAHPLPERTWAGVIGPLPVR